MSKKKEKPEVKIAKSGVKANWVSVIVSIGAVVIALSTLGYQIMSQEKLGRESVSMLISRVFDDYPTQIKSSAVGRGGPITGTISVFWSVIISNNGERDLSLVKYSISDVTDDSIRAYSSMDQGIYSSYSPMNRFDLPVSIEAGHSVRLYIRTGILMNTEAYQLARERFNIEPINSITSLIDYLYSKHIDFYGNGVMSPGQGFIFVPPEGRKEQIFAISFVTARNNVVTSFGSWYTHSGVNK